MVWQPDMYMDVSKNSKQGSLSYYSQVMCISNPALPEAYFVPVDNQEMSYASHGQDATPKYYGDTHRSAIAVEALYTV